MAQHPFRRELSRRILPVLRADGFHGSGTTFRRIEGPVIHVFNIQGSTAGGRCYLNLGAHLDFLPSEGGGEVLPDKIEECQCAFRDRIDPPAGAYGWDYLDQPETIAERIQLVLEEWRLQGGTFFDRYRSFPKSFESLLAKTDPQKVHPAEGRTFVRIALRLGDRKRARDFAQTALTKASERATILRSDLEHLLRAADSGSPDQTKHARNDCN